MLTKQEAIEIRRSKVLELHSKGKTEREIAEELKISKTTAHTDIDFLKHEAAESIASYITDLPYHHRKIMTLLDVILKHMVEAFDSSNLELRDRILITKLLLEGLEFKQKLLTDAGILQRASAFTHGLKQRVEELESELRSNKPTWEVVTVTEPASGKKGEKKRVLRPLPKLDTDTIV